MRSCLTKSLLGAAFMLLANAGLSYADTVIVSNLTATVNGTGSIYTSGPLQSYAQEFLTGSSSVVLSSIIVALGNASGTFTAAADLVADNSGLPGSSVLTMFTVPTIPTGSTSFADLTFTPTPSVTLKANTDYWFVLSAMGSGGSYQWQYTSTPSASFPNYAVSSSNTIGGSWTVGSGTPFLLGATAAAAVPEPSSLVLAAIGLFALGMVVRARRLRASE